ncbi:MAG: response regulator [Flavobacteriales bacterium]|nr:response regulator [Flavobacteriales bacterium]
MKQSILIVDDDSLNRKILTDMLNASERNFSVLNAMNGEIACKLVKQFSPDIILLDWNMPGLSGEEITRKFKADDEIKAIPIIIVTGESTKEKIDQIYDAGANGYLNKPISQQGLIEEIDKHLSM